VSHVIVLSDLIEEARGRGKSLEDSVFSSISVLDLRIVKWLPGHHQSATACA